jgi:hypothetical protein
MTRVPDSNRLTPDGAIRLQPPVPNDESTPGYIPVIDGDPVVQVGIPPPLPPPPPLATMEKVIE